MRSVPGPPKLFWLLLGVLTAHSTLLNDSIAEDLRIWKTRDGKYEVRAELVEANGNDVKLKRADGELITVPLYRLDHANVEYVRQWRAEESAPAIPGIIPDVLGAPIDLLNLIDPVEHTLHGSMRRDGSSLITDPKKRTVTRVPYELPPQYQLRMLVRRTETKTAMSVAVVIDDHQGLVVFDSGYGKKSGLVWIDERNEPNNETYYRKPALTNDQTNEFVFHVHKHHIRVTRDGETIVEWSGDPSRLTLDARWWSGVPNDELLIGSYASPYEFLEFELRPIEQTEKGPFNLRSKIPDVSESVALIEHSTASGTGFLAAPNLLVTNAHVIEGATVDELKVFFPRQSEPLPVNAILWVDELRDLAVLSVKSERPPLPLAHDGFYSKGDSVEILGNPSVGGGAVLRNARVEGTLRSTLRIQNVDLIQIDANINSGSSGGPILNKLGQVVGVTVMKATEDGETMIRQGIRRLDDSIRASSSDEESRGIALAVPGQELTKAIDQVRTMSFVDAARTTDTHNARTTYFRLAILARIRELEAFANVPDQMRRQQSVDRQSANFVELLPPGAAREVQALLRSEPIVALVNHCEQELSDHVNKVVSSDYLPNAMRRDFRVMFQRVNELESLASRTGSDYRRFSSTMNRIQESLEKLQSRIEDSL